MKYRIHYTLPDGSEDSVVIWGDSIEEILGLAAYEVDLRGGTNPWSEPLS